MVEPNVVKCPKCGEVLVKKTVFNESVAQCSKCGYKEPITDLSESSLHDHVLEESW